MATKTSKKAPGSKRATTSVPMGDYPDPRHNEVPTEREWPEGDHLPPQEEQPQTIGLFRSGWVLLYKPLGAGVVEVSRAYHGFPVDCREMPVEEARAHYDALHSSGMAKIPTL